MKKITNPSDTVLIDPNEPLILPDGTALVGRIEWFLYALCCLDYQNLPTPMSRIEEFANALITGEIPNIEPQSRAEQFFLAILDGNVSNLPQPQSRSEVLLDKLARGEFDLSDVEPIQSHYELLLAYLIKNGGIGNIDYVLYEFSEAMKTMYNTVEKPFKSLELSGNTLVNCVLEDTENDDYTSFDKDYNGTSFTINGTSEGAIKSAILKGQTLVNLFNGHVLFTMNNTVVSYNEGVYTYQAKEGYEGAIVPSNLMTLKTPYKLELNKKYTFFITQLSGNPCQFGVQSMEVGNKNSTNQSILESQAHNSRIHKFTFTLTSDYSELRLRLNNYQATEKSIQFKDIMIIEGDYTNVDIPYFEGMKSVKMPVLQTTGKNLLNHYACNTRLGAIVKNITNNSITFTTPQAWAGLSWIYFLEPKQRYTVSFKTDLEIAQLKGYMRFPNIDTNATGGSHSFSFTTDSTGKIQFTIESTTASEEGITVSDIQIEKGSVATPYEPYKSNILTTTSKNLFDMNRPYDVITDSQATVVQDTNQITVSSAESGIYVNANFILDKDFFAGKTVTGSCLYESDEKDIGTVQINYQDGNGEHHYQWIRTPRTFTFPNSFIGDVMLCVSANNTDIPQSNTVTVKNIQLELGSTATSYEPYSEVVLRGIGDVQDTLDCLTGKMTQRIGEIVLDGSENWKTDINAVGVRRYFLEGVGGDLSDSISNSSSLLCDKFKASSDIWTETNDSTQIVKSNGVYFIDSSVDSLDVFVNKLKTTNIKVQYSLIEKPVKTVDLNVVDQNNTEIDKIHVFNETTHVNASSNELTPTINIGKSVSYPTIIKPNTKYTVDLKRNDKPLTVNLGGTEVTFVDGETRKVITTPSTLTNDKLSYYGVGAKCNEIMLIEGEIEGNVDYFTGMQSVVMQNQMPILSTVGKNLLSTHNVNSSNSQGVSLTKSSDGTLSLCGIPTRSWGSHNLNCVLRKDVKYIFQLFINGTKQTSNFKLWGYNTTNPSELVANVSLNGSFIPQTDIILFLVWEKFETGTPLDITNITIQIEEGYVVTSYEPYKSSILSCNDDVTLRGIGDIKDELNLLTGELTERIGEIVLDGSENWIKPSNQPTNTVRFLLTDFPNNRDTKIKSNFKVKKNAMNDEIGIWCDANTVLNLDTSVDTVDSLKVFLSKNPIKLQYSLATESVKVVDLDVVDQDGNTIPKIKSYNDVTHLEITVPKQSLLPNVSAEVATDNSKDMSLLTTKHQEISEAQATIQDNIQSQSDEIDTALMATTEIFESILE